MNIPRAWRRGVKLFHHWRRGGAAQFTVACDYSPWHAPFGREWLIRVRGIRRARREATRWISDHPCGQARILRGWHFWEDEQPKPFPRRP